MSYNTNAIHSTKTGTSVPIRPYATSHPSLPRQVVRSKTPPLGMEAPQKFRVNPSPSQKLVSKTIGFATRQPYTIALAGDSPYIHLRPAPVSVWSLSSRSPIHGKADTFTIAHTQSRHTDLPGIVCNRPAHIIVWPCVVWVGPPRIVVGLGTPQ